MSQMHQRELGAARLRHWPRMHGMRPIANLSQPTTITPPVQQPFLCSKAHAAPQPGAAAQNQHVDGKKAPSRSEAYTNEENVLVCFYRMVVLHHLLTG